MHNPNSCSTDKVHNFRHRTRENDLTCSFHSGYCCFQQNMLFSPTWGRQGCLKSDSFPALSSRRMPPPQTITWKNLNRWEQRCPLTRHRTVLNNIPGTQQIKELLSRTPFLSPTNPSVLLLSHLATGTAFSADTSTGNCPFSSNTRSICRCNMILGTEGN